MFASKLLVRDNGMSTIRLAWTKADEYLFIFKLKNYARWWWGVVRRWAVPLEGEGGNLTP